MANHKVIPEQRMCPVDGVTFEVGGRGRRPRRSIYCSQHCFGIAAAAKRTHFTGSSAPRPRKARETLHDEAWLRSRYVDDRMTMARIGRLVGVAAPSVQSALRKFDIPTRSGLDAYERKPRRPRGPVRGGLTLAEYQTLHDAQGGLCAACGQLETKAHRNGTVLRLAVDHDHDTGRVRALLCSRCNYTLGYARDDVAVLRQLIAYLERHST
jgi:hypothetical protein